MVYKRLSIFDVCFHVEYVGATSSESIGSGIVLKVYNSAKMNNTFPKLSTAKRLSAV